MEQLPVIAHPPDQLTDTLTHRDRRLPFKKSPRLLEAADEYWLIARPPVTPLQGDRNLQILF
jgi:hypothetical protein